MPDFSRRCSRAKLLCFWEHVKLAQCWYVHGLAQCLVSICQEACKSYLTSVTSCFLCSVNPTQCSNPEKPRRSHHHHALSHICLFQLKSQIVWMLSGSQCGKGSVQGHHLSRQSQLINIFWTLLDSQVKISRILTTKSCLRGCITVLMEGEKRKVGSYLLATHQIQKVGSGSPASWPAEN